MIEVNSSGKVSFFLWVYRFGVIKFYSWYRMIGMVVKMDSIRVSFSGVKNGEVMFVVIMVWFIGSSDWIGFESYRYRLLVNG